MRHEENDENILSNSNESDSESDHISNQNIMDLLDIAPQIRDTMKTEIVELEVETILADAGMSVFVRNQNVKDTFEEIIRSKNNYQVIIKYQNNDRITFIYKELMETLKEAFQMPQNIPYLDVLSEYHSIKSKKSENIAGSSNHQRKDKYKDEKNESHKDRSKDDDKSMSKHSTSDKKSEKDKEKKENKDSLFLYPDKVLKKSEDDNRKADRDESSKSRKEHKEKRDESLPSDKGDVHRSRDHKSKDKDKKKWSSHEKDGTLLGQNLIMTMDHIKMQMEIQALSLWAHCLK